jgi:hypothetical protein
VQQHGAALPSGAAGYLALVETVLAGNEGTAIDRGLVRVFAGPLLLEPERSSTGHLLAMRIPQGARTERLGAVGWVESPSGKVVALAQARAAGCREAK